MLTVSDLSTDLALALHVDNGTSEPGAYNPAVDGAAEAIPTASVMADASDAEKKLQAVTFTLAAAHKRARSGFDFVSCPLLRISSTVTDALGWTGTDVMAYLTREPAQRHSVQEIANRLGVEYDAIHFKSDTVDRKVYRRWLHYEIAQAIWRLNEAEDAITGAEYKILYALSDAQLILLLDSLYNKDDSVGPLLGSDKSQNKFPVAYDVIHHRADSPLFSEHQVLAHPRASTVPMYVRTISEEHIIKAYEMLTASSIIFLVRDKVGHNFMASASFVERTLKGEVTVDTTIGYTQLWTQVAKDSPLYRRENRARRPRS